MVRHSVAAFGVVFLTHCIFDDRVPAGLEVKCDDDAQCRDGKVCVPATDGGRGTCLSEFPPPPDLTPPHVASFDRSIVRPPSLSHLLETSGAAPGATLHLTLGFDDDVKGVPTVHLGALPLMASIQTKSPRLF